MGVLNFRERYPPPWRVEATAGGFRVLSSNGYSLAFIYALKGMQRAAAPGTERQSLGYGNSVALSCDQLVQETVNLMRAAADRSHQVLADDQARRDTARQQLSLVKHFMLSC